MSNEPKPSVLRGSIDGKEKYVRIPIRRIIHACYKCEIRPKIRAEIVYFLECGCAVRGDEIVAYPDSQAAIDEWNQQHERCE